MEGLAQFLTVAQVAAALGMGKSTVYEWIYEGKLKSQKFGKSVRIPLAEYERICKEGVADACIPKENQ